MMQDMFLKVRTTTGEDRMVNVRNISMVAPSDDQSDPQRLTLWLTKGTGFDVVGNIQEFESALASVVIYVATLHDFTFEDMEKEESPGG